MKGASVLDAAASACRPKRSTCTSAEDCCSSVCAFNPDGNGSRRAQGRCRGATRPQRTEDRVPIASFIHTCLPGASQPPVQPQPADRHPPAVSSRRLRPAQALGLLHRLAVLRGAGCLRRRQVHEHSPTIMSERDVAGVVNGSRRCVACECVTSSACFLHRTRPFRCIKTGREHDREGSSATSGSSVQLRDDRNTCASAGVSTAHGAAVPRS